MTHTPKNFPYFLLTLTFLSLPLYAQAQEYAGMETVDDSYVEENDNNDHLSPFFVRLGGTINSGTIFDESNSYALAYPFTHSHTMTQNSFSSKGAVLSLGVKVRKRHSTGLQIIGVVKSGSDSTGTQGKLSYTQFGSAMEVYFGNPTAKFILGTLLSFGNAEHPSGKDNSSSYLALEPYIGLEVAVTHHLAILAKVGYEWRDYDKVSYHYLGISYTTKTDAYNVTTSLLLQYTF